MLLTNTHYKKFNDAPDTGWNWKRSFWLSSLHNFSISYGQEGYWEQRNTPETQCAGAGHRLFLSNVTDFGIKCIKDFQACMSEYWPWFGTAATSTEAETWQLWWVICLRCLSTKLDAQILRSKPELFGLLVPGLLCPQNLVTTLPYLRWCKNDLLCFETH